MTHSDACTELVASFEGLKLNAYKDGNGVWTIGYGHILGVEPGDTCTYEDALEMLSSDLATGDAAVNRLCTITLNQNQFDALVSFVYNIGQGNFAKSTLLSLLNQGAITGAAQQFSVWNKIAGKVSSGLIRRRQAEQDLFNKPEAA